MQPPASCPAFCAGAPLAGARRARGAQPALAPRRCARARVARLRASAAAGGWEAARGLAPPAFAAAPDGDSGGLPGAGLAEPVRLTVGDLMAITKSGYPDAWVNEIVRLLLGYRQCADGTWDDARVPDEWRARHPAANPPDFVGDPTDYSRERDLPVKIAVQQLARSIAPEHKNGFREVMTPAGFPGWKVADLTPNITRRAVCVNYIIFWYRMHFPDYKWE